jgi:hypothetical protein
MTEHTKLVLMLVAVYAASLGLLVLVVWLI